MPAYGNAIPRFGQESEEVIAAAITLSILNYIASFRSMKRATVSIVNTGNSQVKNSSFRAQDFERGGVSGDEIQEIKEAFDLFDTNRSGLVRPTCNPSLK